ncbi:hypothetical protein DMN91_008755 [Ooceraea biroi]|uniref:Uncharacterized protein n=1 Tax=Ooceraea biroi TaxID=2015173 RepID=A0A3L8DEQ6_OOCBI|nr:hypothetical protein DMN91_008755 [Ooceraea biroi]
MQGRKCRKMTESEYQEPGRSRVLQRLISITGAMVSTYRTLWIPSRVTARQHNYHQRAVIPDYRGRPAVQSEWRIFPLRPCRSLAALAGNRCERIREEAARQGLARIITRGVAGRRIPAPTPTAIAASTEASRDQPETRKEEVSGPASSDAPPAKRESFQPSSIRPQRICLQLRGWKLIPLELPRQPLTRPPRLSLTPWDIRVRRNTSPRYLTWAPAPISPLLPSPAREIRETATQTTVRATQEQGTQTRGWNSDRIHHSVSHGRLQRRYTNAMSMTTTTNERHDAIRDAVITAPFRKRTRESALYFAVTFSAPSFEILLGDFCEVPLSG